jgi:bacterioferritin-associated ferredoxin
MYVCVCNAVTDREIRKAVQGGVDSISTLQSQLKVGSCCGRCKDCARQVLNEALQEHSAHIHELTLIPARQKLSIGAINQ